MSRTPLRLDRVTLRWEDDDRLTDDGDPYLGCTAVAEVSYPCGRGGSRRLEHLTSGGLWGIDPTSTGEYLAEVERDELADLRDHLTKFGLRVSDAAWRSV